ncbi:hypothetical protein DV738_g1572, partial [Chaetothyriales sp. CBS 135597]
MTEGYREGLAVGKAQVIQAGFDAGFGIGVELGARAGMARRDLDVKQILGRVNDREVSQAEAVVGLGLVEEEVMGKWEAEVAALLPVG